MRMSPPKTPTKTTKKTAAQKTEKRAGSRAVTPMPVGSGDGTREPVSIATRQEANRAVQEGRYVYGIIQASEPAAFGKTGMAAANETVYTVHHGDVAAVVSKTAVFIFDPTRGNALAHEHVI